MGYEFGPCRTELTGQGGEWRALVACGEGSGSAETACAMIGGLDAGEAAALTEETWIGVRPVDPGCPCMHPMTDYLGGWKDLPVKMSVQDDGTLDLTYRAEDGGWAFLDFGGKYCPLCGRRLR